MNRAVIASMLATGLVTLPEFTYAASFNQNLGGWPAAGTPPLAFSHSLQTPPIVIDLVAALPPAGESSPQRQAQGKMKTPPPAAAVERAPSGADIVNKLLSPGPLDPSVPLPHPDLADGHAAAQPTANRPRLFGRGEEGGGVLGLRVPFPADRATSGDTRYGSGGSSLELLRETR